MDISALLARTSRASDVRIFKDVSSSERQVAYPNEGLFTILKRFAAHDVGNFPVVTREKPDCPIGLVTRSGLWSALETAKQKCGA